MDYNVKASAIYMHISKLNTLAFKNKIIDAHGHVLISGKWSCDNAYFSFPEINNVIKDSFRISGQDEPDEIEAVLVSNLDCLDKTGTTPRENEISGNQVLINGCRNMPKIKPLVVCQPGYGNAENIEKLLIANPNSIYGFKFHPMCLGINANDEKYVPYMKLAEKYRLPCVFHSDSVGSFADPNLIYELAKKTPEVPVVLYHMSLAPAGKVGNLQHQEINHRRLAGQENKYTWEVRESWNRDGIEVVERAITNRDANLYVDVSWTKPETVVEAIKRLGKDRVLFGTDIPLGDFINREFYIKNIAEHKRTIRQVFESKQAEMIIDKVFYENAKRLFFK